MLAGKSVLEDCQQDYTFRQKVDWVAMRVEVYRSADRQKARRTREMACPEAPRVSGSHFAGGEIGRRFRKEAYWVLMQAEAKNQKFYGDIFSPVVF